MEQSVDMLSILRDPALMDRGIAQQMEFQPGETILHEGDEDRGLYLLLQGSVRVNSQVDLDQTRHIHPGLCDLEAGSVFGELSLMEAAPRSASVIALNQSVLLKFDARKLMDYLDANPERGYIVLKALFHSLSGRLRQADKRLESLFAWGLKAHSLDQHL